MTIRNRLAAMLPVIAVALASSAYAQAPNATSSAAPTIGLEDRALGKADAPISIVEYASLTCPHCAAFDVETLPKIKQQWIDTGKARLAYRHYPLDKLALQAAVLTRCVPPQRFFGFVDFLFKDQTNWAHMPDATQGIERAASLGGLTRAQADACLKDNRVTDYVVGERLTAEKQYGVRATPTFFINGARIVGDQPYPEFEKALNAALTRR